MAYEVQYGSPVAAVYDMMMGGDEAAEMVADHYTEQVRGRRVLDVGVGTGRVARLLCRHAREVVGVDNSPEMLDVLRRSDAPANLEVKLADFRLPLPAMDPFDAALSTRGSLACVMSRDQLGDALGHVGRCLTDGGAFFVEYYAPPIYQALAELGELNFEDPSSGMAVGTRASFHGDLLTMATTVQLNDGSESSFDETVYLPDRTVLERTFRDAGFSIEERDHALEGGAFDRYSLQWHDR